MKPKASKIRAEINEIKLEKHNGTKSWFYEKNNKIDKPQARITKFKRQDANYLTFLSDH